MKTELKKSEDKGQVTRLIDTHVEGSKVATQEFDRDITEQKSALQRRIEERRRRRSPKKSLGSCVASAIT